MDLRTRGANLALRTRDFALAAIRVYTRLPKQTVYQILGRQMLRSATSVGAQYREAMRAKSTPDFISKIEGASQESAETEYWLELLQASQRDAVELAGLMRESHELTAILVASARTARKRVSHASRPTSRGPR